MHDPRGYQGWPQIVSAKEFVRLRESEKLEEYMHAANGWAEDEVWLEVIAHHPDMKPWVAHNKTVPISILEVLAQDPDPEVRASVANKRKLSRDLFDRLAKDPAPTVRGIIVGNAKMPTDILETMLEDPEEWIREKAEEILAERRQTPKT